VFKPAIMQRAGVAFDRPIVEERESQLVHTTAESGKPKNFFTCNKKQGSSGSKKTNLLYYDGAGHIKEPDVFFKFPNLMFSFT
jgi:hypothetical protein